MPRAACGRAPRRPERLRHGQRRVRLARPADRRDRPPGSRSAPRRRQGALRRQEQRPQCRQGRPAVRRDGGVNKAQKDPLATLRSPPPKSAVASRTLLVDASLAPAAMGSFCRLATLSCILRHTTSRGVRPPAAGIEVTRVRRESPRVIPYTGTTRIHRSCVARIASRAIRDLGPPCPGFLCARSGLHFLDPRLTSGRQASRRGSRGASARRRPQFEARPRHPDF